MRNQIHRRGLLVGLAGLGVSFGMLNAPLARGAAPEVMALIAAHQQLRGVSVTRWHDERRSGADLGPALRAAIDAVKAGKLRQRKLRIPFRPGGWQLQREAVLDASNIIYVIEGDIRLIARAAQNALHVTADGSNNGHREFLHNVALIGNGKVVIDGNGDAMDFPEPAMVGAPNFASLRCLRVKGLYVAGIHCTNGAMDAMSVKQCPGHLIEDMVFSRARYDNGFSATTDLEGYSEGDRATWGGGVLRRFKSFDNNDFGATAFNCSGQQILDGDCWHNGSGASYEKRWGAKDGAKRYHGLLDRLRCYDNRLKGILVDGSGVTIGDQVKTWGNGTGGAAGGSDDPHYLTGYGVVVSSVRSIYIGGDHSRNAVGGVLLTNGGAVPMAVRMAARCNDNGLVGCYARAFLSLDIAPGSEFSRNGFGQAGGKAPPYFAGHGLFAITSQASESAMFQRGALTLRGARFDGNAQRAMRVDGLASARLRQVHGRDNLARKTGGQGVAVMLDNLREVALDDVSFSDARGEQLTGSFAGGGEILR